MSNEMDYERIKEFGEKLKAIDENWDLEILEDSELKSVDETEDSMTKQDVVLLDYDGDTMLRLVMVQNVGPAINVDKYVYIGKEYADMFSDVIRLCGEYMSAFFVGHEYA